MTISLQQLLILFVSLFTLYSPLSNLGPYASLVGHFPRADQKKLAFAVFIIVVVVMVLFVWAGELLFNVLGVNPHSLTITGGIALMIAGIPMMLGSSKPDEDEPGKETQSASDMAVFPMTFPMTLGGETLAYIVSATAFARNVIDLVAISIVVTLIGVVMGLTLLFSPPLAEKLNPQTREILHRVGGILLVTIAVQLIVDGLQGLFPILAG